MAPNHPELLFLEAKRALSDKDKRKKADQMFSERRSRAMMPKFILEESKALSHRKPEAALKVLQEGLEHFGEIEELWFKLANLLNSQGHAQAALQTVDKRTTACVVIYYQRWVVYTSTLRVKLLPKRVSYTLVVHLRYTCFEKLTSCASAL